MGNGTRATDPAGLHDLVEGESFHLRAAVHAARNWRLDRAADAMFARAQTLPDNIGFPTERGDHAKAGDQNWSGRAIIHCIDPAILKTTAAFAPPKPKEFESTVCMECSFASPR